MPDRPEPRREPPRHDPDTSAQRLRRRFQRISRRWEFRIRRRRFWRTAGIVSLTLASAVAFAWMQLVILSPWPPVATIKHLLAFPNCGAARAVGLAPAQRGQPGYWSRHDADHDGIACEPFRPSVIRG